MLPIGDDNPTESPPIVTVALIVACVAVFLWQLSLGPQEGERAVYALGAIPAVLFGRAEMPSELAWVPAYATLFTSMFMHGGWGHLLGNMLFLWIFGNNVEDSMGKVRFVVFYLLCGVVAALSHAMVEPSSEMPMVGASGAISGVMGAYILLHPHARVRVLIFLFYFVDILSLPAWLVLGLWFVMQGQGLLGAGESNVAWWAHIGGFVAGALLIVPFKRRGVALFQAGRPFVRVQHLRRGRF